MKGAIKDDLTLNDRVFICECGYVVDRDLNAALNIERQALNIIRGRSGFTDSLNAQGQDVRPVIGRSWMNCENMAEERQPSNPAVV
jgi:transposase